MKLMAKTQALALIALAGWLAGADSLADPLHKVGDQSAWRHENSGWLFPKQVGSFTRAGAPYTIDGGSDVGGRYVRTGTEPHVSAVVDVYAADSAAAGANLQDAKAVAAGSAGAFARLESEAPFLLGARDELRAIKVTYVSDTEASSKSSLYFIETDRWIVKVVASTQAAGRETGEPLDVFVNALPWDTLGTDPGQLH